MIELERTKPSEYGEMKILLINEVFGTTSTGKICAQIAEEMEAKGNEVRVAYGRWKMCQLNIKNLHIILALILK